jgi:FMN reductase
VSVIIAIAGSPSHPSRSTAILEFTNNLIKQHGLNSTTITVRHVPAEDLIFGRFDSPSIRDLAAMIGQSSGVVIATPVYRASYSGVLKAFLDILPQQVLAGKIILPIAAGGSVAHLLSIDYALKPVLAALGARYVLGGVYAVDSQIQRGQDDRFHLDPELERRLYDSVVELVEGVRCFGQNRVAPSMTTRVLARVEAV